MKVLNLTVIVAALGYFVDIFDLLLFSILRVPSLQSLGVPDDQLLTVGVSLLNHQMMGVLVGGIFWGMLGDKKGRVSVLFGSILLYSLATLANAFIHSIESYSILRFVSGLGLAGELGVAITLVSEILSKETRGYATTIVASFGVLGSVAAGVAAAYLSWRTCYIAGGALGLLLLVLRIRIHDPALFQQVKGENIRRGNFLMLFMNVKRFQKYISLILVGAPVWFIIGIVVSFSPEIAKALGCRETVSSGTAVLVAYIGLAVGDMASGVWSQLAKTRKKVIAFFLSQIFLYLAWLVLLPPERSVGYYFICFFLGVSTGYWAVLNTMAAESFGTNLRATAATTIPNFIRGSLVPIAASFQYLREPLGIIPSIALIGVLTLMLSLTALYFLPETYGKELGFLEK